MRERIRLKIIKVNNSYETDPSFSSASSASEGSSVENRRLDEISNLPDALKPKDHQNEEKIIKVNAAANNKIRQTIRNRYKESYSCEESKFLGFPDIRPMEDTYPVYTYSKGKDICNEYKQGKDVENCILKNNFKMNILSEILAKDVIYETLTNDNSSNAVDIKLLGNNETNNTSEHFCELSFNGKIRKLDTKSNEKVEIPSTTESNSYKYISERSPDLFEEVADEISNFNIEKARSITEQINESNEDSSLVNDKHANKDKELLKRIQNSLSGVPPPPSCTILQIDLFEAVINNKENIFDFYKCFDQDQKCSREEENSFKPLHPIDEVKQMNWKDLLSVRHHGISYNISKTTEKIELLSLSVVERFVGAETSSSYQNSPSSSKKRNMRLQKLTQSPGSRLSHLARRRAIFSSANLQSNSQKLNTSATSGRILIDLSKSTNRRKSKISTPKRRTPGSRKKIARKTPSSSARKRLLFRVDNSKPGPSRETSKRALFQSPPQQQQQQKLMASKPIIKPEVANRVERSKRALFSPDKFSQISNLKYCSELSQTSASQSSLFGSLENLMKRKRNSSNTDNDDDDEENVSKIFRSNSQNLTPRALKIKSQSFCGGAGTSNSINNSLVTSGKSLIRASSDSTFRCSQFTENHKKKLLWAVSQALQGKQIGVKHPKFKQYASELARSIKALFLEYFQKSSNSTSETMLRLAKKYVYCVMLGKTADEIYLIAKSNLDEEKKSSKLSGYIAPEDYENLQNKLKRSSSCFFSSETTMDSFVFSQTLSLSVTQTQNYQSTEFLSQLSQPNEDIKPSAIKLPIQLNKSLQNSSSKNNLGGSALRENIDCEQRRSAQKNFTGKDQKNVSPYNTEKMRSGLKTSCPNNLSELNTITAKAKRQISFDN